eukprot:CAMPEP_0196186556 /NCGR_PEP_ID=MMETSP0911-20130528/38665_1 /TAXON_ID=49265 /ORGANISM="Thalassiosira rotula, Strain GSO102" /LENGTH=50 /DNA_ID=CAMNT_0041457405 /DNA_START=1 /DNA_END=156 /DNA_ORIENTATION=+
MSYYNNNNNNNYSDSKGEMTRAFSYLALNNVGGVMAAFAGFNVAKRILSR